MNINSGFISSGFSSIFTRLFLFTFVLLMFSPLITACGGSGSNEEDGILTAEENDIRVGTHVIRCAMTAVTPEDVEQSNNAISSARLLRWARGFGNGRASGSVTVPVVVHVISSGSSPAEGNVSDGTIAGQIRVLNERYAGAGGGISTPFRFAVQQITRTVNPAWAAMEFGSVEEREAKSALRVGDAGVLNLYLANPQDGTLGWAAFPWDYAGDLIFDGVVLLFGTLPGEALAPYNQGITGVHEVGHWLGLFHTFQDGCGPPNDSILDTPPEAVEAFGCPLGRNTCGGDNAADPVTNYMDYSDDACLVEFSTEQVERKDLLAAIFRGL